MSFKDTVNGFDLDNIFFNEDEHAEAAIYYPLGDLGDPKPITVIWDEVVIDDDIMNPMEENIIDSIPRIEAKQTDIPKADDADLILRVKDNVMYRLTTPYYNDNGVVEFHLTRTRRYGSQA